MSIYNTYSDGELVKLLQRGDEEAFREIYERYWKKLFYKAGKKLNNTSLAEELVQDIFLDIWNRRETLALTGELGAYLATAATYKVINCRAKLERQKFLHLEAGRLYVEADATTENALALSALQQQIERLVAELPSQTKLVYQLHQEAGYSYTAIASELNISPKTVGFHISKAFKSLRAGLSQLFLIF